jgi:predicted nucleic acid-binding protein
MTEPTWLIDKSALARLDASPDAEEWVVRIARGRVQITTPTLLEAGYSAQSGPDWTDRVQRPPISLMPVASLTPVSERRAVEVQGILARRGHHRAPSVPDLLIAAIAETAGLTILHVDKVFELIAELTGQLVEGLNVHA